MQVDLSEEIPVCCNEPMLWQSEMIDREKDISVERWVCEVCGKTVADDFVELCEEIEKL